MGVSMKLMEISGAKFPLLCILTVLANIKVIRLKTSGDKGSI